jgi:hypothetical protein
VTAAGARAQSFAGRTLGVERPLVAEPTLFVRPSKEELPRLRLFQSLGARWPLELLLPTPGTLGVYTQREGQLVRRATLATELQQDISLRRREGDSAALAPGLGAFTVTVPCPQIRVADLNADGRLDIALVDGETLQGFFQSDEGFEAEPNVSRTFSVRTGKDTFESDRDFGLQ